MDYKYLYIYAGLLVVGAIIAIVVSVINKKKMNRNSEQYLAKYPNAARIYTKSGGIIVHDTMAIYQVDGEYPCNFSDSSGSGTYAKPGTIRIICEYTWTRPGVMYKSVTKSTGETTLELEIKPRRRYSLTFNKKTSEFKFDEIMEGEEVIINPEPEEEE